jgi:hypothetical protein
MPNNSAPFTLDPIPFMHVKAFFAQEPEELEKTIEQWLGKADGRIRVVAITQSGFHHRKTNRQGVLVTIIYEEMVGERG